MLRTVRNAKGFTLVELAIVLVIIGIILGAVLKGQELINNAKMKRAYNQTREITAALYTYMDRYGKLPGDDNTIGLNRWNPNTYYTGGDGNGLIILGGAPTGNDAAPGTMFTCGAADGRETCGLWDHLRRSNILSGPLDGTNPTNAYGGTIGIANVAVQGLTTNWIGLSRIPMDVARQLDTQYDDGVNTSGSIRSITAYAAGETPILLFFRF